MTIDHAIYELLSSDSGVQAVISDPPSQISSRPIDALPQITFARISSPGLDDDVSRFERWRFFCRSVSYTQVDSIAKSVYNVLHNGVGTVTAGAESIDIDRAEALELGRSPEWTGEWYERTIDIRILRRA